MTEDIGGLYRLRPRTSGAGPHTDPMRGLSIVGSSLDAHELRVCAAACLAARASGTHPSAFVPVALGPDADDALATLATATGQPEHELTGHRLPTLASPLVAADHGGVTIEPAALLQRAAAAANGDVLMAALSGGVLAPLTPRYAVRDFARDFGAPVVLATPADPDAVGLTRLAIEAARAVGLAVAAVVLTAWPDSAGRVLLDERARLEELTAVDVRGLPESARGAGELAEAATEWPLSAWLEPAPVAPDATRVALEPYHEWEPRELGDPRSTPRPAIMAALAEIVAAEGPMTATRAYTLYNRASGGRKLTGAARLPLASAVDWLARERKIVLVPEDEIPWQGDDVVRAPDSPAVRARTLGPRTLDEVPLDEISELVAGLRSSRGLGDSNELKRAVLAEYGLIRLTARADEYLGLAVELAG